MREMGRECCNGYNLIPINGLVEGPLTRLLAAAVGNPDGHGGCRPISGQSNPVGSVCSAEVGRVALEFLE